MANVVSAAVVSGELIIGLDDGSIIRAGYVQGPQGLAGPQGPIGATGAPGVDGNTILSSQGYPRADQGKDGDFHINTRDWEIRGPKAGGSWPKAKSMLPGVEHFGKDAKTIINMGGSGGGGGTGAPAIERPPIIDDGSGTPPTIYPPQSGNPGSNLQYGDMWLDNNGALHFYYNNQWNKVGVYSDHVFPAEDAPYAIITPNGEVFTNQKEYNEWLYTRTDRRPIVASAPPSIHPDFPADPLRVGDYWIDDNNRLYYWNGTGWEPIEGSTGRNPIFDDNEPTEHPDYAPPDNVLEVGDIWYDTNDNFKQYIYDGSNWVAISADRFEAFTRIYEAVDPAGYNSGNDGTCALTATGSTIDTITNVKVAGTDQQSKVRYAYAAGQSIVIEDDRNGAYAVLSVTTVNGVGDYDVVLIASNGTGNLTLGQNYSFGELTDSKVQISDNPPSPALEGDLWWNSDDDELTLYVYYDSNWVPAAPPVSLDGINTTIATALEIQEAIIQRLDDGEATQATLQGTINTALGTQVQIQADINTLEGKVSALEDGDYLETDKANEVTNAFRVKSSTKTFISTNNNELGLYNLADPTNDAHAVNRGYADGRYLKKTGGTLTGNLLFNGGSRIDANTGNEVLSGRACFEIRSAADLPVAISSGSSFKPLLAFYGYNGSSPDNKEKVAEIKANGNAYFTNVYSQNEKLATEDYVDARIPAAVAHLDFKCTSSVDPTYARDPAAGQIVGYYENNPGDGSKAHNQYIGNWVHSVRIHVSDLKVSGTLPAAGSSDYQHRGIFEMHTSNGEKLLHKAVVSSMNRSGDVLTLNFEGGMNLYGTSDTTTQSSTRYLFYSLL